MRAALMVVVAMAIDFDYSHGDEASVQDAGGKWSASKPNILWIMIEDWSTDLSCYGTPLVHTPNIDRLASEGIRFEHAYTTSPVCSTSRSAMMTGFHQKYMQLNRLLALDNVECHWVGREMQGLQLFFGHCPAHGPIPDRSALDGKTLGREMSPPLLTNYNGTALSRRCLLLSFSFGKQFDQLLFPGSYLQIPEGYGVRQPKIVRSRNAPRPLQA